MSEKQKHFLNSGIYLLACFLKKVNHKRSLPNGCMHNLNSRNYLGPKIWVIPIFSKFVPVFRSQYNRSHMKKEKKILM